MIARRALLFATAHLYLFAPPAAIAQSRTKPPVIGVISSVPAWSPAAPTPAYLAFRQALHALGYVEGRTIVLENRRAAGLQVNDYLAVAGRVRAAASGHHCR